MKSCQAMMSATFGRELVRAGWCSFLGMPFLTYNIPGACWLMVGACFIGHIALHPVACVARHTPIQYLRNCEYVLSVSRAGFMHSYLLGCLCLCFESTFISKSVLISPVLAQCIVLVFVLARRFQCICFGSSVSHDP